MQVTVAVDCMGGDHGAHVTVPAVLAHLAKDPESGFILVGRKDAIEAELARRHAASNERLRVHPAAEVVEMDEQPASALRGKKNSSMRLALDLVKAGEAQACVSAGNTGALMAISRFVLKTLPGIDRPAIATILPTLKGHTHVLDLGANVDCTAEHLFQFAVMGSVLASAVHGLEKPRIGLLNIGEEEIKGNEQVKEAARLLAGSSLHYTGFVEGDDVYIGGVDVVVCDGFVGNVALKTSEGVAKMISHFMRQAFSRNVFAKLAGLLVMPVLKSFRSRIDPRKYNGASLLGLRGIVIKSHGGADAVAFENAINVAALEVQKAVPDRIEHLLEDLLNERSTA